MREQGHFEPDDQHAEAEPLKDDGTDTFRQAGSEGKPHKAADGDAQSVDDGPERDHARVSSLPYRFSHSPISFLASARNSGNTARTSSERPDIPRYIIFGLHAEHEEFGFGSEQLFGPCAKESMRSMSWMERRCLSSLISASSVSR